MSIRSDVPPAAKIRSHRLVRVILLAMSTIVANCATAEAVQAASDQPQCDVTHFCTWTGENYQGERYVTDLVPASNQECVPLPAGVTAVSFINRTGHPVTVFEDPACSLQGYFSTHSPDTNVMRSPHTVRALKVWVRNRASPPDRPATASRRATALPSAAR
jgi:hypothetical protein